MIPENIIEEITARISKSVDKVLIDQKEGRIETEPSLTDRLLANIERDCADQVFSVQNQSVRLRARTLRDRGRNAPESVYGADLTTVLDIEIDNYKINKGLLAQSKSVANATIVCSSNIAAPFINGTYFLPDAYNLNNPTVSYEKVGTIEFGFAPSEFKRLKEQCKRMLKITPDSFVYLYCNDDIYVIPASAVDSTYRDGSKVKFYCKNFKAFFSDYLKSFIGDMSLSGTTDKDFDKLIAKTDSRQVLYLTLFGANANR